MTDDLHAVQGRDLPLAQLDALLEEPDDLIEEPRSLREQIGALVPVRGEQFAPDHRQLEVLDAGAGVNNLWAHARRSLAARAALLLLPWLGVSACGSDDEGKDAATTVPAASETAAGSGSIAKFCEAAAQVKSLVLAAQQAAAYSPPAKVKAAVDAVLAAYPSYEGSAPAALKDAVTAVTDANRTYYLGLKAAGYTFTKMDAKAASALESPAAIEATTAVESYVGTTCGATG